MALLWAPWASPNLNLDGLPAAEMLQRLRPERRELATGQLVIDKSAPRTVYPDGKHAVQERTGLAVYPSPEDVPDDWLDLIYRVGVVKGLRWVVRGGEPSWVVCDALTVLEQVPSWRLFGQHGEEVAAVLEGMRSASEGSGTRIPARRSVGRSRTTPDARRPAVQGLWPRRTPGDRRDGAPRTGGR